jgi:hypothetical protein
VLETWLRGCTKRGLCIAAIDPAPYNKTFSPALDHLLALQKQVANKTRRLEEEMKIAERDYAGRLRDMHGDFVVSVFSEQLRRPG